MENVELLVKDGEVWTPGGFVAADIAVRSGKIVALGKPPVLPQTANLVIDAKGKKVIPGLIDTHTHHRDPGFTHKEDITTATMAAAAGGVTLSIGMPNVNPPTTTVERYRALVEHHSKNAIVDFKYSTDPRLTWWFDRWPKKFPPSLRKARWRSKSSWSRTPGGIIRTCPASVSTTTASCSNALRPSDKPVCL